MALFSYPVCTWLCQYVNMGVRKWLEKSAEKQKYKLCKTLNPLSRKAFRAVSFSATKDIFIRKTATFGGFSAFNYQFYLYLNFGGAVWAQLLFPSTLHH